MLFFVSENARIAQDHYTIWPEGIIISIFDIKIETSYFGAYPIDSYYLISEDLLN